MDALEARIKALRRLAPEERLEALRATLPVASDGERAPLTTMLLELAAENAGLARGFLRGRGARVESARDGALALLIEMWRYLPEQIRRATVSTGRGRWARALGERDRIPPSLGRSLAELSIDTSDPGVTSLLGRVMRDGRSDAVPAAARALLAAAIRLTDPLPPPLLGLAEDASMLAPLLDRQPESWSQQDVDALTSALASAIETFDQHHRKEVLLAAILLLEHPTQPWARGGKLGELASAESDGARALATAFRRARAPIARQRSFLWCREPGLASACADRVSRAPTELDHLAMLPLAHLALAPARARVLGMIPIATRPAPADEVPLGALKGHRRLHPQCATPSAPVIRSFEVANRRQTIRLLGALKPDAKAVSLAADWTLADADALTRLMAVDRTPRSDAAEFCFDVVGPVARRAALLTSDVGRDEGERLAASRAPRRRQARVLERSPHRHLRRLAIEEGSRLTPGLATSSSLIAARREWTKDDRAFGSSLESDLRSSDPDTVIRTLMLARRVGAVGAVEGAVLGLVRDSLRAEGTDHRIAATAVGCLGDLGTARAGSVLLEFVRSHTDARVRSNAAEALWRCGRAADAGKLLEQLLSTDAHRLRASAIRSLIFPLTEPKAPGGVASEAGEQLATMLVDTRADHRMAGVWVVQRSIGRGERGELGAQWDELAGRVRWLAESDTVPRIKTRALTVCRRLNASRAMGLSAR